MTIGRWYIGTILAGEHFICVPIAPLKNGGHKAILYHFDNRRAIFGFGSANMAHACRLRETTPGEIIAEFGKTEGGKAVARITAKQGVTA